MSLPISRNTTYAAASQVKSVDLNDLQDQTIALWAGKHGTKVLALGPSLIQPSLSAGTPVGAMEAVDGDYFLFNLPGSAFIELPLVQGDRISLVSFDIYGDGAADLTSSLRRLAAGVPTSLASFTETNPASSWATSILVPAATTLAAGQALKVKFAASAANLRIGNVFVTYDHP